MEVFQLGCLRLFVGLSVNAIERLFVVVVQSFGLGTIRERFESSSEPARRFDLISDQTSGDEELEHD